MQKSVNLFCQKCVKSQNVFGQICVKYPSKAIVSMLFFVNYIYS